MFWETFSALCAAAGKSPNAVAQELDIPSGSVTAWKRGTMPRNSTVIKLAKYFSVSVDFLLGEQQKKPAITTDDELFPGASTLSEENKARVRDYIALLLNSQRNA